MYDYIICTFAKVIPSNEKDNDNCNNNGANLMTSFRKYGIWLNSINLLHSYLVHKNYKPFAIPGLWKFLLGLLLINYMMYCYQLINNTLI